MISVTTAVCGKASIGDHNEGILSNTFADADTFHMYCNRFFGREEQATMITLTGLVVVLMIVAQKIADLFELVKRLFGL